LTTSPCSIHNLGLIGHIEEIAIEKDYQSKGLGLKLLASLASIAKNVGCYKTILGTSVQNEPFYVRCGYQKGGHVMSQYYETPKDPYYRG
jgi:glucosamine-phosphate N-acetyltransferase